MVETGGHDKGVARFVQSSLHSGGASGFCRLLLSLWEEGFLVLLQTWVQAAFSGAADVKSGYGGDTPCPAVAFAAACGDIGVQAAFDISDGFKSSLHFSNSRCRLLFGF